MLAEGLIEIDRRGGPARGDGRGAARPLRQRSSATRTATCGSGEIEFGRMVKDRLTGRLKDLGLKMTLIDKDLGYELRCADPIPFDAEYTRDLGYGAVKFLLSPEAAKYGAVISLRRRHDAAAAVRHDDQPGDRADAAAARWTSTARRYECARRYMIRLERVGLRRAAAVEAGGPPA